MITTYAPIYTKIKIYDDTNLNNYTNKTLSEYIHDINKLCYNIDTLFINDMLTYIFKDECCIPQIFLEKYNIIKIIISSNLILKLLNKYNYKLDVDYQIIRTNNNININLVTFTNTYLIHPKTFKYLLMVSRNSGKYRDYYICLEEYINCYNNFQMQFLNIKAKTLLNNHNIILSFLHKTNNINIQLLEINKKLLQNTKKSKIINKNLTFLQKIILLIC